MPPSPVLQYEDGCAIPMHRIKRTLKPFAECKTKYFYVWWMKRIHFKRQTLAASGSDGFCLPRDPQPLNVEFPTLSFILDSGNFCPR